MGIKGYKVFNPDWTCRDFQYEVGKTFKHNGNIEMCGAGFHFCQKISDCFNYYKFNSNNKVAEVEAVGLVETQGDKSVTDEIRIVREISWSEVLMLCNTGVDNTGFNNSGNANSGNRNSGIANSGSFNSGNVNSGSFNSGDWNSTNFSSGFFNSVEQPLYVFNKPLEMSRECFLNSKGLLVLRGRFKNNWWIFSQNMTDEEKSSHPEHIIAGGYLKTVDFKTACKIMWESLNSDEKQAVKEIPNFDAKVFEEITGIDVENDN